MSKPILHHIHVGKCGGETVKRNALQSTYVRDNFGGWKTSHTFEAKYSPNELYLISFRNPIQRLVSAFNWRYMLVVETKQKPGEGPAERNALTKYPCINDLAEELYSGGVKNEEACFDLSKIGHVSIGLEFHAKKVLQRATEEQIYGVTLQESLNVDMAHYLNITNPASVHIHSNKVSADKKYLSQLAKDNLRKWSAHEYVMIERLRELNALTQEKYDILMK